jgi:hypothetical protein
MLMNDLIKAREEAEEALFNIGKLAGRISYDEGRRLDMMLSIVTKYIQQLEGNLGEPNND